MILNKIIFSVDQNPDYDGFWKINSEICKKHLGIEPVLFRITDEESDFYRDEFGLVKDIKKVPNIDTGLQSQIFRIYGTKYFMNEVCMIGDIDLLIFDKQYIKNILEPIDENELAILCSDGYDSKRSECIGLFSGDGFRYPMAYITGKGITFSKIINNNVSFYEFATEVNSLGFGFNSDEIYFASCLRRNLDVKIRKLERGYSSNFYCPRRIEKNHFIKYDDFYSINPYDYLNIKSFIDCHCPKPFQNFKTVIEKIKEELFFQYSI